MFSEMAKRAIQRVSQRHVDEQPAKAPAPEHDEQVRFILGLDLGQASDFTALALLRRLAFNLPHEGTPYGTIPRRYDCLAIKRWPLGTSYTEIVASVNKTLERPELAGNSDLIVDATGVGRPVVDMLRKAKLPTKLRPVTITAGASESIAHGYWNVAKIILVSTTNILLQQKRLKFAERMPEVGLLIKELQNYRVKVTAAANETFNAREGQHDDLVLALALACWWGERGRKFNMAT